MLRHAFVGLFIVAAVGCATARPAESGKEFTFVDGAAGQLRVSDGGSGGVPVVFIHGLGGDLEAWRAQLDHVRATRRAVAYDQRGHGNSQPAKDGVYTAETLAEDLDRVLRSVGAERAVLVGHSLAGIVLSAYAERHPEKVAALVYVDAIGDVSGQEQVKAFFLQPRPDFDRAKLRETFGGMFGPDVKPATRERVLASVERVEPSTVLALWQAAARYAPGPGLARYTGPRSAIEAAGQEIPFIASRSIPGVTRTEMTGVSHWLMMDDPATFNRGLDEILGQVR
jgi:pimeloyl-ACP methyl ester carboxylesterase